MRGRAPDAIDRVRREIKRLERELGPLASTLAILQAKARGAGQPVDLGREEAIRARMETLQCQLDDLRMIVRGVRAVPRDVD